MLAGDQGEAALPASDARQRVVERLRAAGCVFAEDEAELLGDDELLVSRRIAGERLEHLLGWTEFCGLRIDVEPGVFIPRPQTEELAERAAALRPRVALDLFTGSGAIAAVIARRNPAARVIAADVDPAAVACARSNGEQFGFQVLESDVDSAIPPELAGTVDLITANVPYVPTAELSYVPHDGEPLSTLDGGPDGERWVRAVIAVAPRWLASGGVVLFEGPEGERVREWRVG